MQSCKLANGYDNAQATAPIKHQRLDVYALPKNILIKTIHTAYTTTHRTLEYNIPFLRHQCAWHIPVNEIL